MIVPMEYTQPAINEDDWRNRIKYHRPDSRSIDKIASMRGYAFDWGLDILESVPQGREQSLALTHIETALFWANAGIAREPDNWDEEQPEK